MTLASLVKISPLNPISGERVAVRVASANDKTITGHDGKVWEPAMLEQPQIGIALWNGDFGSAVDPGQASLSINMETVMQTYAGAAGYIWTGAPIEIYADDTARPWPWPTRFIGRVSGYSSRGRALVLTAKVDTEPFDANVLTATYAGTGGAEGGDDLKNRVKPLVLGWAKNVEPVMIDAVNSVYQFSGYGGIEAVSVLYERGSDFGAALGNHATYAALVAATIPPGDWATCLASGMVRLGAPDYGVITGDVKGHKVGSSTPRLTGAVITALATIAGVSSSLIETASLAALDVAAPYPVNVVIANQTTFLDAASNMALACNWQSGIQLLGAFFVAHVSLDGDEVLTLDVQGGALPLVLNADEQDVQPPYFKTTMGADRSWRVHSMDEVAVDLDLAYSDGTPIDDLQPSEAAADVTMAVTGAASATFTFDYQGNPIGGQFPRTFPFKLIRGASDDVTADADWSADIKQGNATFTIGAATGILEVTALAAAAIVEVTAEHLGSTRKALISLLRSVNPPPSGGSSQSTSAIPTVTSNTYGSSISPTLTVTAGPAGQVALSFPATYWGVSGSGLYGKWQRDIATVWTDEMSEAAETYTPWDAGEYGSGPGGISVADTVTGLTDGVSYSFRLTLRNASSGHTNYPSGTASAVGS